MQWVESGLAHSIQIPFIADGTPVIPDNGTVTVSVLGHTGAAFSGWDNAAQAGPYSTQITLSLTSDIFNLGGGSSYEARFIKVNFAVNSKIYHSLTTLRVAPWVPLQVVESDVRQLIGAEERELPNGYVDIYSAYQELVAEYGADFSTALASTTVSSLRANQAVAVKAALACIAAIPMRLLQSESTEYSEWVRSKLDFKAMEQTLRTQLGNLLEEIVPDQFTDSGALFILSTPTDVITGV